MADSKQTKTDERWRNTFNYATRESGLLLPEYRLPTETEWEYAALALSEISEENLYRGKKKFPWDGEYTRSGKRKNQGDQLANFKLGKVITEVLLVGLKQDLESHHAVKSISSK